MPLRMNKYLVAGFLGAGLVLAGPLLPYPGRSPLGASFLSAFPYAAAGIAALALAAAWALRRRSLRLVIVALALILVTAYPFFNRYYYPDGDHSLFSEPGRRATAIPGWACVETGALLVACGALGMYFVRRKEERGE